MHVCVTTPTGKAVTLGLQASDLVEDLKASIQVETGLPTSQQCLIVAGEELKTGQPLSAYAQEDHISVLLVPFLRGGSQIFVRLPSTRTITVDALLTDTVRAVKETLEDRAEHPAAELQLFYQDKEMEDDLSLADHGVGMETLLTLKKRGYAIIDVEVPIRGCARIWSRELALKGTLGGLKREVEKEFGLPLWQQQFQLEGKELEDECRLVDCNLGEGANLRMTLKYPLVARLCCC